MTENLVEYCKERKGKILETAEQLYQYNEEYRKSVDEERLYPVSDWHSGYKSCKYFWSKSADSI